MTTTLGEIRRLLKPGGRFGVNSADASRPHQSAALVRDAAIEEGLDHARVASSLGANYRVNERELEALLREAGFVEVRLEPHTFVDTLEGVDDLLAWSESSSFGNFLADLDPDERRRLRRRLEQKLEPLRTRAGIRSSATSRLRPLGDDEGEVADTLTRAAVSPKWPACAPPEPAIS